MITIFEFGDDRIWTGASREIGEADGVKGNWTRAVPPAVAEGEHALFAGGRWSIVTELPRPILPDLTMRQFRLGLLSAGLLAGVEAAIDGLDEPERSLARIEFEYASIVVRTDPWVATLAVTLGLTDTEIDTLWTWAAGL